MIYIVVIILIIGVIAASIRFPYILLKPFLKTSDGRKQALKWYLIFLVFCFGMYF